MLKARVLSAVALLPLVLAIFMYGPAWLALAFVVLCTALSVREAALLMLTAFSRRFAGDGPAAVQAAKPEIADAGQGRLVAVAVAFAVVIVLTVALSPAAAGKGLVMTGLIASLLLGAATGATIDKKAAHAFALLGALTLGTLPWLVVWDLYALGPSARYLLLLMAIAWCGDTGGYFGGRFLGGRIFGARPMAPVVSPKKTWEGAVAGLLMSILGAFLMNKAFDGGLGGLGAMLLCGFFGGVFEQLGDLFESTVKRFAHVKDSGSLIPGHGGFLDRVDGILFAAPVIWIILFYLR
jgi:phosphatidate cytidylyltransferase